MFKNCILAIVFFMLTGSVGVPAQEAEALARYAEGLRRLFPDYAKVVKTEARGYSVQDADGAEMGRVLVEYAKGAEKAGGFNGPIELAVAFKDNKAVGVLIGENNETPQFLMRVADGGLTDAWNDATLEEIPAREVTPVTGATYSSKAIIADVRRLALAHLKYRGAEPPEAPAAVAAAMEECGGGDCEHGGKPGMKEGGCEHGGGKKSMGGCEHGAKESMGGCEHGAKKSMGGCEHGGKKSMGGCEHGEKKAMGGCEHGGKKSRGGCEHGEKKAMGGCEHGGAKSIEGCEHGGVKAMGGCEHGGAKAMDGCEHGGKGHGSCGKQESSDASIAGEEAAPDAPEESPTADDMPAE